MNVELYFLVQYESNTDTLFDYRKIELSESIDYSLNKQFIDLEDLTSYTTDYSKTIKVPMTPSNNELFNYVFKIQRIIFSQTNFFNFDPTKKIRFELLWNNNTLFNGYAILNDIDSTNKTYNITLTSSLNNIIKSTLEKNISEIEGVIGHNLIENIKITPYYIARSIDSTYDGYTQGVVNNFDQLIGFAPQYLVSTDTLNIKNVYNQNNLPPIDIIDYIKSTKSSDYDDTYIKVFNNNGMSFPQYPEISTYMCKHFFYVKSMIEVLKEYFSKMNYTLNTSDIEDKIPNELVYFPSTKFNNKDFGLSTGTSSINLNNINNNNKEISAVSANKTLRNVNVTFDNSSNENFTFTNNLSTPSSIEVSNILKTDGTYTTGTLPVNIKGTTNFRISSTGVYPELKILDYLSKGVAIITNVKKNNTITKYCTVTLNKVEYAKEKNNPLVNESGSSYIIDNKNTYSANICKILGYTRTYNNHTYLNTTGINFYKNRLKFNVIDINNSDEIKISLGNAFLRNYNFEQNIELKFTNNAIQEKYNITFDILPIDVDRDVNQNIMFYFLKYKSNGVWHEGKTTDIGEKFYEYFGISINNITFNNNTLVEYTKSWLGVDFLFGDSFKPFKWFIEFCKKYRYYIEFDEKNNEIKVYNSFFKQNNGLSIINKQIDYSKSVIINPIINNYNSIIYNYNSENNTLQHERFKEIYGYDFGDKPIPTQIELNNNILKISNGNEICPMLICNQVTYFFDIKNWNLSPLTLPKQTYPFGEEIFLINDSKDKLYNSNFYLVRGEKINLNNSYYLSTYNDIMLNNNTFSYYTPVGDDAEVHSPCSVYRKFQYHDEDTNTNVFFNTPDIIFTNENIDNTDSIYQFRWKNYLNEIFDVNNKKITCYVPLTVAEYYNFRFNQLWNIEGNLFIVNKIIDYNPTNNEPTKVELIQVNNIENYN